MVLMPVSAFFGFLGGIHFLSVLIGLAINLYGLWILYHALNESLKANPRSSKVLSLILAGVVVLFMLIGLATWKAVNNISRNPEKFGEEIARKYGGKEAEKTVKEAYKTAAKEDTKIVLVLEKPDGSKVKNPKASDLKDAINTIKDDNDFVILNRGKNFLQVAKSGSGYLLQYKDKSGLYECKNTDFAQEIIVSTFITYLNGGPTWGIWKQQFEWQPAEQ